MADPKGSCSACPLQPLSQGFVVEPYGSGSTGVLLLGEALGEDEVSAGRQFAGKAGQVLDRLITRTKDPLTGAPFKREDFWTANVLSCRPPNNDLTGQPYEHEAISKCRPNLERVLGAKKPRVIVALGNQPLRWLTGYWGIEHWRGSVIESPWGWVVPTFHPSYIMRGNFHLAQVWIHDLLRAIRLARGTSTSTKLDYILNPTPSDLHNFILEWREMGRPCLAFDIETPYSPGEAEDALEEIHLEETKSYEILRIGASFKEGHAITMPFIPPFKEMILGMLSEAEELTVFFEEFDVPRLVAAGAQFKGKVYDAMKMFHRIFPPLPYNLQFATSLLWTDDYRAWKHLSSDEPEWYNCHDNATLLRVYKLCREKLEKDGGWENFCRHFVEIGRILRKMSKRGIAANQPNRLAARQKFQGELEGMKAAVQELIPQELKPKKVFKISKDQLEKKYGPLEVPRWITVTEPLSEKEISKRLEREARLAEKERVKAEREALRAVKAAERALKKAVRSTKSRKKRPPADPSGECAGAA